MSRKMTLLEMTQDILSAMESDEVNSISDTVESLQVAQEIKTTFQELTSTFDLPSNEGLISLQPSGDIDNPNIMYLPDDVKQVKWITYNHGSIEYPEFLEVRFMEPELFYRYGTVYNHGQGATKLVDGLYTKIDGHPRHWTTFDNKTVVFDSYNSNVDSTLQETKTQCWGTRFDDFKLEDDFVPRLDPMMFPLLLAEAKKACFVNFKQISNANEERRARRQAVKVQSDLWRLGQRRPYNRRPDYSRPRR